MTVVRGLPQAWPLKDGGTMDLSQVPPSPLSPYDPDRAEKLATFRAWHGQLRRYRIQRRDQCEASAEQQELERLKCERYGAAYFLAVWGWMDDPRISPDTERVIGSVPFIPYPFQVDMLQWFEERLTSKGAKKDGVISKSRDMGATWSACGYAVHGWLFKTSFKVRLVSRSEILVDRKNDPDSMFAKIDFIIDRLPPWLLPNGFVNTEPHRLQLRLKNPENKNVIAGEATTSKTMRGSRATMAFYDEAAFIPGFLNVWATGVNAASTRIAISSESLEEGDDFIRLRRGNGPDDPRKPALLELDYWLHPEHGEAWLEEQRERFGPDEEGLQREVFRNPHAGFGTFIYKEAQHIAVGDYPYDFGMPLYIGIDPGRQDLCAMVAVAKDPISTRFRVVEAYAARGLPPEYYASLLLGMPSSEWDYTPSRLYDPHDWMALMRNATEFFLLGDPAGYQKNLNNSDSWYSKMQDYYAKHHPFNRGLNVIVKWAMKDGREFQARRAALMRFLPHLDFNDTEGVRALVASLQDHKFEKANATRMREAPAPKHNDDSHPVAALEYCAVNIEEFRNAAVEVPAAYDAA